MAVECDAEGMLPDALERACRTHGARLLYLNPTQQNPTTATLSAALRARWPRPRRGWTCASSRRSLLALRRRRAAAAGAVQPQRVYYISTLSKCLSPGLRTAFVLLPDGVGEDGFLAALRSFALMSTPLTTALVTQWIHDGSADVLHRGVREEARLRLGLAGQVLGGAPGGLDGGASGIHVWYPLPSYWTPADAHAARAEAAVTPAGAFRAGGAAASAIRISLGGVRDRAALGAALKKLSALLARRPQGAQEIVV